MRWIRATVSFLVLIQSTNTMAEWSAVGAGDYIATAYADRATIKRNGAMVSMSGMYDFKRQDYTPEGKGLYSTVVLREYDCDKRRVRLLSSIDFAGQMGTGAAVDTSTHTGRWEDVVAGALDEAFWKIACSRD
jgi:hypothetical protein